MPYLRPGVYIEETLNPNPPIVGPNSDSVAAFVGTSDKGPVAATLVTSWSQFTSLYGSWSATASRNKLITAVYMFFANGGSRCYVKRVTAGTPVVATSTFLDSTSPTPANTLTVNALNAGAWGNDIWIGINTSSLGSSYFDLTVYYSSTASAGNAVERFTDITMLNSDPRYAISVINGSSAYITVVDASPSDSHTASDNPAPTGTGGSVPVELANGADGTAPTDANLVSALTALDTITQSLILNLPGVTAATEVNGAITYAAGRGDVFVVIDPLVDTVSAQLTRAAAYTSSSYAAVYYPSLVIPDPTSSAPNAITTVPTGAAVMGRYVATDASRGIFKSPAGLDARLSGVVSVAQLTNSDLDALNSASAPVNAIRYVPGSGIVVMGARTLKPGYADRYVSVRRSLIYLKKSLEDLTGFAIFEPNDERLWNRLTSTVETFLTDFWQQGGLRGLTPADSFYVKCDEENNTINQIDNGNVVVEVGVALQRPAEFVVIRISQYDSGAVVTIS
jgi:phage tail sheath protein FI